MSNKKAKLIGAVLGILLFCILITGLTYAWFTWKSNKINVGGNTACFDFNYIEGNAVTEDLILIDASSLVTDTAITIKKGMAVTNVNAGKSSSCNKINAKLYLSLIPNTIPSPYQTSGSCEGALNYVIVSYDPEEYGTINSTALNGETFYILKTGTITSTSKISNVVEEVFANDGTMQNYLLIFYIDGSKVENNTAETSVNIGIDVTVSQVKNITD